VTIRLVLADDHPVVLAGLVEVLRAESDFEIVASATNGDEALTAVRAHRPDVLVLDLRMPVKDGLAVLRDIHAEHLQVRVVVLTALDNDEAVEAACLGAQGLLLKEATPSQLAKCIRAVHDGRPWLDQLIASRAVARLADERSGLNAPTAKLTPRELEVARLAAAGLPSKVIARKLSITEGTAKLHLHHVYEKLKLSGRFALAHFLQEQPRD